jgi:tRNA modification GTPase
MIILDPTDTIAAISTPPGPGLRGIIRVSGPQAWRIAAHLMRLPAHPSPSRTGSSSGKIALEGWGHPLDVLWLAWPAGRSATGDLLVELHLIGSPPVLELVLDRTLQAGARLAQPGEFTLRAFLAGRIDLTQAEAVLGVIEARSDAQLKAALNQLAGGIAHPIQQLRDRLLDVLAHLEAGLDFVDERDVDPLAESVLGRAIASAQDEVTRLAEALAARERPGTTFRAVLVGPPNAGKSSLFNALTGEPRALVSPIPGTTRDYLVAAWDCAGHSLELIDTAGIHSELEDTPDHRAQLLRDEQTRAADLLLFCQSADAAPESWAPPGDIPRIAVWTKADVHPPPRNWQGVVTSTAAGTGLDGLKHAVAAHLEANRLTESPMSTSARCHETLVRAARHLAAAARTFQDRGGDELVAIDLRAALDDLGQVVGAVVSDDVLGRIFARFCIGK